MLRRLQPNVRRTLTVRTVGPRAARLDRLDVPPGAQGPSAVLVAGLAGGCEPGLAPGDVILGDPVSIVGDGREEGADPELRDRAMRALDAARLRYRVGRLLTVDDVVTSPAEKARWWRSGSVVAVDMESAHVLAWARRAGLPGLAVRVVADGPGDDVPSDLLAVVGADGRMRARTVAQLLGRPSLLPSAWRLGRRSHRALESLGRFMRAFVDTPGAP